MHLSSESSLKGSTTRRHKNKKAILMANEQYQRLREKLSAASDVQEKNLIFRRLINLLEVMEFLNSDPGTPCVRHFSASHAPPPPVTDFQQSPLPPRVLWEYEGAD